MTNAIDVPRSSPTLIDLLVVGSYKKQYDEKQVTEQLESFNNFSISIRLCIKFSM